MKKKATIAMLAAIGLAGCAATYTMPTATPPSVSATINAPSPQIMAAAKRALIAEGYQITSADENAGTIATALKSQRLWPEDADCGTTMGIDYLKDSRTSTRVGFGILLTKGVLTVVANIEGEYKPGNVSQNITLSCVSRGGLENALLSKIQMAVTP